MVLRPSLATAISPDGSTDPRTGRGSPRPFREAREQTIQLACRTNGSDERAQISPDVRVVLITEGGLELPLVVPPGQVARLLECVSEMAAGINQDGPLQAPFIANQRPRPVRTQRVLQRVRVVVHRGTSTEADGA
jgi:hypothetical protein